MARPAWILTVLAIPLLGSCTSTERGPQAESPGAVLVAGATGTQGGAVARELLRRGYSVHALTRNPQSDRAAALAEEGAIVVRGDFSDPASLRSAMEGADGVFAMTDSWSAGVETEVEHGRNLIEAAVSAGVEHFVYSSVSQADTDTGVPHFDSKARVEALLRASGLDYTILRPVEFMDNLGGMREELMENGFEDPREASRRHQWIAAQDIGFFVGEAFDDPKTWIGESVNIAGDEMTVGALVALLSEELGVPIRHEHVSWDEFEAVAGPEMTVMHRWFDEVGYQADVAALRKRYPELVTVREFVRSLGWR